MSEENPVIAGSTKAQRDPKGRFRRGYSGNPDGHQGPKQLTAQQFIDHLYAIKGDDAIPEIWNEAFRLAKKGNTALLCKILDKILPSKIETKQDLTVSHREEFMRMRARAVEILNSIGARLN